jgi:hypothetical protein
VDFIYPNAMKTFIFHSSRRKSVELLRAISYASLISAILFFLIFLQNNNLLSTFQLFAILGLGVLVMESVFSLFHTDSVVYKKNYLYLKNSLLHHTINHLFYPVIFYLGLTVYILYSSKSVLNVQDLTVKTLLIFVSFCLYAAHFYFLRKHIHTDHVDSLDFDKSSFKVDIIYDCFKFFSYFIVNLSFFQLYSISKISLDVLFFGNLALNFSYLLFHLNRKYETNFINVFTALLFSIIASIFVIKAYNASVVYSATFTTIIFYLMSGVFYHKIEGALSYRILLEYVSISIILSLLLFSF